MPHSVSNRSGVTYTYTWEPLTGPLRLDERDEILIPIVKHVYPVGGFEEFFYWARMRLVVKREMNHWWQLSVSREA